MRILRSLLISGASIALTVPACSNPLEGGSASCDMRTAREPDQRCQDSKTEQPGMLSTLNSLCESAGGTVGARCPRESALGGCYKNGDAAETTNWYYPSDEIKSAEDVKKRCGDDLTFVTP